MTCTVHSCLSNVGHKQRLSRHPPEWYNLGFFWWENVQNVVFFLDQLWYVVVMHTIHQQNYTVSLTSDLRTSYWMSQHSAPKSSLSHTCTGANRHHANTHTHTQPSVSPWLRVPLPFFTFTLRACGDAGRQRHVWTSGCCVTQSKSFSSGKHWLDCLLTQARSLDLEALFRLRCIKQLLVSRGGKHTEL